MNLSLIDIYRAKLVQKSNETNLFVDDPAQSTALKTLNQLFVDIETNQPLLKGVYLWGDVGRGKTFLMDLFYQNISSTKKLRLHFHRFMANIHQQLNTSLGIQDPLVHIAKQLAKQYQLICFDEFFVSDIGDAIILARLFENLFNQNVILVATSNIEISRLYEGGLQRERFLPFIDILNHHCNQVHLSGEVDHRIEHNHIDKDSQLSLKMCFSQIDFSELVTKNNNQTNEIISTDGTVTICNRQITYTAVHGNTIWFDFTAICEGPRSQLDYIQLASQFTHIIIDNVPQLGGQIKTWIKARGTEDGALAIPTGDRQLSYAASDDPARRFISLVDELYDQHVTLTVCSAFDVDELYQGSALAFEFRRTISRLIEMKQWQSTHPK
ncbi:cell division protein ZapE [Shewanella donghaensis]|uniref:cell division protein ZapE n=1 Tax=Shewanella donghaensis TaxID=238836 RepID=UPI001183C1CC|nr:cell division protein ZapE [Shewanella donghaensis]